MSLLQYLRWHWSVCRHPAAALRLLDFQASKYASAQACLCPALIGSSSRHVGCKRQHERIEQLPYLEVAIPQAASQVQAVQAGAIVAQHDAQALEAIPLLGVCEPVIGRQVAPRLRQLTLCAQLGQHC